MRLPSAGLCDGLRFLTVAVQCGWQVASIFSDVRGARRSSGGLPSMASLRGWRGSSSILLLGRFRNRVLVLMQWAWSIYAFNGAHGS
jgi:hypothetical protein